MFENVEICAHIPWNLHAWNSSLKTNLILVFTKPDVVHPVTSLKMNSRWNVTLRSNRSYVWIVWNFIPKWLTSICEQRPLNNEHLGCWGEVRNIATQVYVICLVDGLCEVNRISLHSIINIWYSVESLAVWLTVIVLWLLRVTCITDGDGRVSQHWGMKKCAALTVTMGSVHLQRNCHPDCTLLSAEPAPPALGKINQSKELL